MSGVGDVHTKAQVGSFRILEPLGKGGMGVVYLAESVVNGDRVALKTLEREHASRAHELRREIAILARLTHPGIVRLAGEGQHEGLPWYAMEYLEGRTLRAFFSDAEWIAPGPAESLIPTRVVSDAVQAAGVSSQAPVVAWDASFEPDASGDFEVALDGQQRRALRWMSQVCRALAYMHGEGVIHCDLKPSNILVTDENQVKLLDFGVAGRAALRVDADSVDRAGMRAGTALYMPPERILGESYDARADLYTLGIILFQIVARRVPFTAERVEAILFAQLREAPPPLESLGVHVPRRLERLMTALLAKRPAERPGHVDAVLDVLDSLHLAEPPAVTLPAPRPYLYQPELVGRQDLLLALDTRLVAARNGEGNAVLLGGGAGVGKSRVALELVREGRGAGMQIVTGEGTWVQTEASRQAAAPLGLWRRFLRRRVDAARADANTARRLLGPNAHLLAPFVAEIAEVAPTPPDQALAVDRRQIFAAVADIVAAAAEEKPVLLILDDLQWADDLSTDCVRHLVDDWDLAGRQVCIVGLYRTDGELDALSRLFQSGLDVLRVERLGAADVSAMAANCLAIDRLPRPLEAFVQSESSGNPFFVAEYLALLLEQGVLQRDASGRFELARPLSDLEGRGGAPRHVQDVVGLRIANLEVGARNIAQSAAVLGRFVPTDLVRQVAGVDWETLNYLLDILRRRDILEDHAPGYVRFVHERLREAVTRTMPENRARLLHSRAAHALAPRARGDSLADLADVASHFERGGDLVSASRSYRRAAATAAAAYVHSEAERYLRYALELADADALECLSCAAQLCRDVLVPSGQLEEAEELLASNLERTSATGAGSERAAAFHVLASVLEQRGESDSARLAWEDGLAIASECGAAQVQADCLEALAYLDYEEGRLKDALSRIEAADGLYRHLADTAGLARCIVTSGRVVLTQGDYTHAMALFQHAQGLFQDLRDRGGQASALRHQAQLDVRMGRLTAAERRLRAALELLTRTDLRREQASILLDLGSLAQLHGRYAECEDTLQNAVEMCRAASNRRGEARGLTRLGHLFVAQGKPDLARVVLDLACDLVAVGPQPDVEWEIQALLGDVAVGTREFDVASDCYERAMHLAERRGDGVSTRVLVRIGRLHLLTHNPREAASVLEGALGAAQHRRERGAEAEIWLAMARLHRQTVQPAKARDAIRHARTLAAAMGEIRLIAQCKAELGILRAADGEDASFLLDEATRTARQLGCTSNSELGRAIGELAERMGGQDPPTLPA